MLKILLNPLVLARLAGVIGLVISLAYPTTPEAQATAVLTNVLTWAAGKFEEQPEVAKPKGGAK